jgi:LPXTG-site transpeptidase (sortase) family protein
MPKIKKPTFRNSPKASSSYSPIFSRRTKILLFSGLFLILVPLAFYLHQSIQLMFFVPEVPTRTQAQEAVRHISLPTEIAIPAISLTLPVEQTALRNNTWGISAIGVSHLDVSASPGESGPIIMYGHNTNSRFGPIRWLKKGSEIQITTSDKKTHRYTITETLQVNPDELSVFFRRKGETLYLYTCDGVADLKRYIVVAEPKT